MIAHKTNNFNVDITEYLNYVANVEVSTFKCPHCHNHNMKRHGYYNRYIIVNDEKKHIRILRVKCKSCGKTHAVLPPFVVPYLHTPINDLHTILINIDGKKKLECEAHMKKTYKRIYKFWVQKLLSLECWFKDKLEHLMVLVSSEFHLCFSQIHRGTFFWI